MHIAYEKLRTRVKEAAQNIASCEEAPAETREAAQAWLDARDDARESHLKGIALVAAARPGAEKGCEDCKTVVNLSAYLTKRSQWIVGGDGASYDIGFGGLDHVIASGKNVNILVLDTEVYSNTGGQSSKSTPIGAIAKFAAAGKRIRKKDLGLIATTYGYVYVAQIAMGADNAQTLKAIREAEAYDGPSLVIAYAPCINHGIKKGMGHSQEEEKQAVECGYWHLWRYNPELEAKGENPFSLDSKEPDWSKFNDFLKGEVRFASLYKMFPQDADELFAAAKANAQWRYNNYKRLAAQNWGTDPELTPEEIALRKND